MIVLGDISGIQSYLFDVAEVGGGQAQRLRARSFYVQLLAETAALHVRRALRWPPASLRLSGAGKFLLEGPGSLEAAPSLARQQQEMNDWLRRETRAGLRLTLAWADVGASSYSQAQRQLQQAKTRPWAPLPEAGWEPAHLLLEPLDTPCGLCGHAPAVDTEQDRDTKELRRVCRACASFRQFGQRLPRARWLLVRETPRSTDFEMLGLGIAVTTDEVGSIDAHVLAVANLQEPGVCPSWCPPERFLERRLMAHVPTDAHGSPVWFTDLASRAQGDPLLAVLKADVDSLGVCFQRLLETGGLEAMAALSEQMDAFFAGRLRQELASAQRWQSIYTIFAGGDDLVMVGPWNIMVDFAGQMREWFREEFRGHELTLSAGLALFKPKRPIKVAVAEAERLLEQAKDEAKDKDRLAAFGQVWPWQHHDEILHTARQLVQWVSAGAMERGWLHTLLELTEARHGKRLEPLATARLAYHVDRNYEKPAVRSWGQQLIKDFDNREHVNIAYLPATVRYALTATRKRDEEE